MNKNAHGQSFLDIPVFHFPTEKGHSAFTIRHAVEGVQIVGGIGSGKTSGSGRFLALNYLKLGFGGLVLTAKPDEKDVWIDYCTKAGRLDDLIIIEPGGKYWFDFLAYESSQNGSGNAFTENVAEVLKVVIESSKIKERGASKDDPFWQQALDMLIFNTIDLCLMAYDKVTVQLMHDIVQSLPTSKRPAMASQREWDAFHMEDRKKWMEEEEIRRAQTPPTKEFKERKYIPSRQPTHFEKAMVEAHRRFKEKVDKYMNANRDNLDALKGDQDLSDFMKGKFPHIRTFHHIWQFFMGSFRSLNEKTRSIIEFSFTGFLFRLLREPIYSLFCKGSYNVTPEDSLGGKIIVLNLPVKSLHKVGRDCQILFKYIWQRAMEKRNIKENPRPVFLWADEAQNFIHEHDPVYQATARSSCISTVYITQNLPNYYAMMESDNGSARVKSFLGTMGTKIFHANADIETNQYASNLVGEAYIEKYSETTGLSKESPNFSQSKSIELEKVFRPEDFIPLKTGSSNNAYMVEGIIHRQGDPLFDGNNYMKLTFDQKFTPS